MSKKPLECQVGGDHYKKLPMQPLVYTHANREFIGHIEGDVIAYVSRHRLKGGAQDLHKAIHMLKTLLQLEYNDVTEESCCVAPQPDKSLADTDAMPTPQGLWDNTNGSIPAYLKLKPRDASQLPENTNA